ncbi:class I SAM-dependent methyltransferase [Herbidospora sp. RD11066]
MDLGSSFGTAAPAYAEHRPDYALAAVRWALEPALGSDMLVVEPLPGQPAADADAIAAELAPNPHVLDPGTESRTSMIVVGPMPGPRIPDLGTETDMLAAADSDAIEPAPCFGVPNRDTESGTLAAVDADMIAVEPTSGPRILDLRAGANAIEPAPGLRALDPGVRTDTLAAADADTITTEPAPGLGAPNRVTESGTPAAVDARRIATKPTSGSRVLDLGAGTGKLTAALVTVGADVIAVEPDPAMLAELRRSLPGVRALLGSAEAIPLPDASVDVVVAGNAMHWFDMDVAGPEIARVLVPGGVLAGLWNVLDDETEWVAGLAQVSGGAAIGPRDTPASWRNETAGLRIPPVFGSAERAEFPHGQRRTADSLVATLATRAGLLVMPEPERRATLARIRDYLADRPETADGEFTLPMLTAVLRVVTRG